MYTLLVSGGRDYEDRACVYSTLYAINRQVHHRVQRIVHGGARGADCLAARWGKIEGIDVCPRAADWDTYGKAAGHRRNAEMLTEFTPDIIVLFPGGRGTASMEDMALRYAAKNWPRPIIIWKVSNDRSRKKLKPNIKQVRKAREAEQSISRFPSP